MLAIFIAVAHINLRELLVEIYSDIVVGTISSSDEVRSKQTNTGKTHDELGLRYGMCWRYNPMTRTVYWNDDSQRHTRDDEFRVEDHLEKKYNYPVTVQVDLESDDIDDPNPASDFNRAHGYIRNN